MISHILRIISRNKVTTLLSFLLLSAAVLVNILSIGGMMQRLQYYFLPRGYELDNIGILYAGTKNKDQATDSIRDVELYNRLKASPYVEKVSFGTPNLIYNYNRISIKGHSDTIFSAYPRRGDEEMADLMGIRMLHGRWLRPSDHISNGIVVTPEMAKLLFHEENVTGKSFEYEDNKYAIVGVCNSIRQSKQSNFSPSFFYYEKPDGAFTIRTKTGEEPAFSRSLENLLASAYGINNYIISYETISDKELAVNLYAYMFLLQFLLSRVFMLLVALLSFVAVIWFTSERRKQEWSIRYALGRSKPQLIGYIFLENLVILMGAFVFALVVFFAIRYFGVETFTAKLTLPAIAVTAFLMLIFLWIGIWIPSRKIKQLDISELLKSE
ncbi:MULTISPECIES: ABC transporter permease [Proteiniphilum]|jgi:ABC-type antimicrobial peptide transport system permease subunit|uniref:ABC transporter permease n=1 Tax=Proteiniphilum TaxID=294702 RepID=UPI000E9C325B|nr:MULTISPECIES: FtsX-like permease family protein [Proteiniphilum]ULB33657.1 ABC transporter permease [Proteiniphilum propionicum]HBF95807.1 hypothetical protein [Porphyromonadaceae bacterium]HBU46353.1 hypothetical protein [Porphyromonadaceae bacterium]